MSASRPATETVLKFICYNLNLSCNWFVDRSDKSESSEQGELREAKSIIPKWLPHKLCKYIAYALLLKYCKKKSKFYPWSFSWLKTEANFSNIMYLETFNINFRIYLFQVPPFKSHRKYAKQGMKLFEKKRYDEAIVCYTKAIVSTIIQKICCDQELKVSKSCNRRKLA